MNIKHQNGLKNNVCPDYDQQCSKVKGWYNGQHILYLHENCNTQKPNQVCQEIAFHELTHWLQHINGAKFSDCSEMVTLERQSYAWQTEFRLKVFSNNFQRMPQPMFCIEKNIKK